MAVMVVFLTSVMVVLMTSEIILRTCNTKNKQAQEIPTQGGYLGHPSNLDSSLPFQNTQYLHFCNTVLSTWICSFWLDPVCHQNIASAGATNNAN